MIKGLQMPYSCLSRATKEKNLSAKRPGYSLGMAFDFDLIDGNLEINTTARSGSRNQCIRKKHTC